MHGHRVGWRQVTGAVAWPAPPGCAGDKCLRSVGDRREEDPNLSDIRPLSLTSDHRRSFLFGLGNASHTSFLKCKCLRKNTVEFTDTQGRLVIRSHTREEPVCRAQGRKNQQTQRPWWREAYLPSPGAFYSPLLTQGISSTGPPLKSSHPGSHSLLDTPRNTRAYW